MTNKALNTLDAMASYEAQFDAQFAVPEEVGMFLHDQILENKYKRVLELGTWRGASAIYMASAIRELKEGTVTTVNIDVEPQNLEMARENFQAAGVDDLIYLEVAVAEDFLNEAIDQNKDFDLIFIDADKLNVDTYLDLSLELLSDNGTIYIDDAETMAHKMPPGFIDKTLEREDLDCEMLNLGNGLLQIKKR